MGVSYDGLAQKQSLYWRPNGIGDLMVEAVFAWKALLRAPRRGDGWR